MYKLMCRNFTKCNRSLTNFTNIYKKVIRNFESRAAVQTQSVISETDLRPVEEPKKKEAKPSFFSPKNGIMFLKRSLFPRKSNEKVKLVTYSIPSRCFYSSTSNKSKNESKSTRKVFKDKKCLKMYKTAIQQCTKIKLQRQRMHRPYDVCWRPKPYQDVFLKEEKVIAGKRKLKALAIKPVPQPPKIETNAPLNLDEQMRIKLKWQKAMNRNGKKNVKIVYPTHLVQFRLSMQKPYHINQPKEATQEKPEQPEKPALSNNKYYIKNGVDTIEFIPPKDEKIKNLEILTKGNSAPGKDTPEGKPEIFDETLKHSIKVHPTQRRVSKSAKMSINKKYNVFLLKNQRKAQAKLVNKQEINSEEKTKPTRIGAGEYPTSPDDGTDIYADSTEVTKIQKDPLKLETSENDSTPKITQHPILASNKPNDLERRIRYPKNILAQKNDTYDIDEICLKTKLSHGSYTNESNRKIDLYQKDNTNAHNQFLDSQEKNQDETVKTETTRTLNDATKKHVQSDNRREISYEQMNSSRKDIAGYLRKLNGLKDQTALVRSKITKNTLRNTDMVQKVEVHKRMPEEKKRYDAGKAEGKPEQNQYQKDEPTKGKTTSVVDQIAKKLRKNNRDEIENNLRKQTDYKSREIGIKSKLKDFKTSKSKYLLENFKPIETVLKPTTIIKPKSGDELPQKALSKTNRNLQKILEEYKVDGNTLKNQKEVSRTEQKNAANFNKRTSNLSENSTNIFAGDMPTPNLEKPNEKSDSSVHRVPTKKGGSSSDTKVPEDLNMAKIKEIIIETPNKNCSIEADSKSKQILNTHEAGDITKDNNDQNRTEKVKEKIKYFEKKLVTSNKEPEQFKNVSKPISTETDTVNHKGNTKLDKTQVQREEGLQRKTNDPIKFVASEKSAKYTTAKRELDKHLTKQQNKKLAKETFKYILKDVEDEPTTNNSKKQEDSSGISKNFTETARTTHADINQNETKSNTDENKVTSYPLSRQKKERDFEKLEKIEHKSVTADNIKKIDMNEKYISKREEDENIKDKLNNKIKSLSDGEQKLLKTIVKETYVIIEDNYVSKDNVAGETKKSILQEKANNKLIKENDNENGESMKVVDKKNNVTEQVTKNLKENEAKRTIHPNELMNYTRMKMNNEVKKTPSSVDLGDEISDIADKNIPKQSLDRNTTCGESVLQDYKSDDAKKNNTTEEVSKHSIMKETENPQTKKTEPSKNLLGPPTSKELLPNEISNKKVSEDQAPVLTTKLTNELKNLLTSKHRDRSQVISSQSSIKDERHLNSESKKHTTSKNVAKQSEKLIVEPVASNPKGKSNMTPDAKKNDPMEEASKHLIIKETKNLQTKKTEPSKNLLGRQTSKEPLENEISNKKVSEDQVIILITNSTNELKNLLTSKHRDTSLIISSESSIKDERHLNSESKKHTTSKNVAKQSEKLIVDPVVSNSKVKSNMAPSYSVPVLIANKDTESRGGITSLTDFVSLHNKAVAVKEDEKELQIIENKNKEKDSLFQNNRPTIRKEQPPLPRDDNKKQKSKTKRDIVLPPRKGQTTPQLSSNKPIINNNTNTVNNNSQSRDNLINRDKYEIATAKKHLRKARSVIASNRKPKPISREKQLVDGLSRFVKNDNADNESLVFKTKLKTIQNFDEIDKTPVNTNLTNKLNVKVSNTESKEKMQISEEFQKSRTNTKKPRAQSALLKMYLLEENELSERPFASTNAMKRPSWEKIKRPNIKQTYSEKARIQKSKTVTKGARNLTKNHSLNKSVSISKPAGTNGAKMKKKLKSLEEMNQDDSCKDCFPLQANVDKKIQLQTSKSVEHKADHGKEKNEDKKLVLVLTLPKLNDLSKVSRGDKQNDTTKTGSSSSSPNLNTANTTKLASNENQSKQVKEPGQRENLSKGASVKTKSESSVKTSNRLEEFCPPDAYFEDPTTKIKSGDKINPSKKSATGSKELPVKKSSAHNKLNEDKSKDTENVKNASPKLSLKVLLPKTDHKAEKLENVSKTGSNQTEAVSVIRRKSESDLRKMPARKTEKAPGPGPKRNDVQAVEAKINEIFHLKDKVAKFNKKLSKYVQSDAQLTPEEKNKASLTKNEKNDAKEQGMKCGTQSKRDEDPLEQPTVRVTKTTVEKTLPTLPVAKKTEKSLTVYSKFCNQLCIPPKTVSQVVFSKPAEDLTTLNKNNALQIVSAPKKHLEKYKNLKITFITLKRHQEKNDSEDFLPAIMPLKSNHSKRDLDFGSDTAEMMAFRYELLKKLHEEFSSLMEQQENEGNFEKVVEYYKRIMEKHTENKLKMSKTPTTKTKSTILNPKSEQTRNNETESLLKNLNKHKLQDNTSNNDKSGKDARDAKSPEKPKDDSK